MPDPDILVRVTADVLQLSEYIEYVQDDGAGAISTFSGVTRNVFDGKKVIQLEYEAYKEMAEKVLKVRSTPAILCSECSDLLAIFGMNGCFWLPQIVSTTIDRCGACIWSCIIALH